ncbi:putative n-acetyltransferase p20 [Fagus crenata]
MNLELFQTSSYGLVSMSSSRISQRLFKLTDVDDFLKWASDDRVTRGGNYHLKDSVITPQSHIYFLIFPNSPTSFVVGIDYWGQGIVTTAMKIAVSKVFKEFPDFVRIEAKVEVENKGSQKVLENVVFLKEGLLRKYGFYKGEIIDMFIYSFLVTDSML